MGKVNQLFQDKQELTARLLNLWNAGKRLEPEDGGNRDYGLTENEQAAATLLNALANDNSIMLGALEAIAGGRVGKDGPDIMSLSPESFRSAMWSWSQETARTAVENVAESEA